MKEVLVTVDDGPSENTPALADLLEAHQIPSIMFFQGCHMEALPQVVDYILQKGVVVGNHSYSHPHFSALTRDACLEEIDKTEALITQAYLRNGKKREQKLFRFPFIDKGGAHGEFLEQSLLDRGFDRLDTRFISYPWYVNHPGEMNLDVAVTLPCFDWELNSNPSFGVRELREKINVNLGTDHGSLNEGPSGEIFLFHDFLWKDPRGQTHVELIVKELLAKPLKFVTPKIVCP